MQLLRNQNRSKSERESLNSLQFPSLDECDHSWEHVGGGVELCIVGLCGWMSESDCRYESLSLYIYISVACVHAPSLFAHVWAKKNACERLFLEPLNFIYCFFVCFELVYICMFAFVCICIWIWVFVSGFLLTRQLNRLCLTAQQKLNSYSHSSHNSRELTPDSSRPGDSWYMCVWERL